VTGAGPLMFFDDPGKSGFEVSASSRIIEIYRKYGFRANSGEGGKPYGMELYTQAFYVCWQFQHRDALGLKGATLESLAAKEGSSERFAKHIWSVLNRRDATYPTSDVIAKWKALAVPAGNNASALAAGRAGADQMMRSVIDWPRWLLAAGAVAEGGEGDERALVLNAEVLEPSLKHKYVTQLRSRGKKTATIYLQALAATGGGKEVPYVIWHNPVIRTRGRDRGVGGEKPLRSLLDEATVQKLGFGKTPDGRVIPDTDFTTRGAASFDIPVPEGTLGAGFQAEAELPAEIAGDAVLRTTISDAEDVSKGRPIWALLGNPAQPGVQHWKKSVLEYASILPQNSQGEVSPSDKDPIPLPFNNVYNQPERDRFHVKLKYYRVDQFLVDNVLDDKTRTKLNDAWSDLLASFEYHDVFLRFVAEKYKVDLKGKKIADLQPADIAAIPAEPRQYVQKLKTEYDAVQKAELAARPRHVNDCIELAAKAWRRPLTSIEKDRLRAFYMQSTEVGKLDHGKAIEALVARVLVAPAFLYRLEQPAPTPGGLRALSDWELASRLSYFLWASAPDAELHRAAAAGELKTTQGLERQTKRMLADPKARRLATEFFGQWLGFYHFDQYKGVDAKRFPEFTDEVKSAMYDEAVSFFEHIVRQDRPVREIYNANYTFLNAPLAKHYGIKKEVKSPTGQVVKVDGANEFQRGGLLRLGAVLTVTSAPLRTSPVKRGDWMLRRVLGTPTPPPPADAGSIPADDKQFGGMSVKERLAVHKRNATCASCHTRIDPLGFPLERFDPVGRWRESYADGKKVDDTAELADKTAINGIDGLLDYLKTQEPQVLRTMSFKLLGYALGRTVMASDQPLIDKLTQAGGDATFSRLAAEIVTSKQFRNRREEPAPTRSSTAKPVGREGGL